MDNIILKITDSIKAAHYETTTIQRYHAAILGVLIFLIIFSIVSPELRSNKIIGWLVFLYWFFVICYDLLKIYERIYTSFIGKTILSLFGILLSSFSYVIAKQIVNEIVGEDPSIFPVTIWVISIILDVYSCAFVVVVVSITTAIIMGIIIIFKPSITLLIENQFKFKCLPVFVWKIGEIIRVISLALFCASLLIFTYQSDLKELLKDYIARPFLFKMEMYQKAPCKIPEGSAIVFLGEGKVLIGTEKGNGISLEPGICKDTNLN